MKTISHFEQLDLTKQYSYADYLQFKFKERVELIKGFVLKMSPTPSRQHQTKLRGLFRQFDIFFKNHTSQVYFAPFDVRLQKRADQETYNVVQPDLCVICDETKLDDRGCVGAPDLIVEILSPGNSKTEMTQKFALYEECGVNEYWIVQDDSILIYVLENGTFIGKPPVYKGEIVASYVFPALKFNSAEIYQ